jgi:hypothetical protein
MLTSRFCNKIGKREIARLDFESLRLPVPPSRPESLLDLHFNLSHGLCHPCGIQTGHSFLPIPDYNEMQQFNDFEVIYASGVA